ncbi:hypothetical protein TNCV_3114791 [Trichonephila clavipes]|nr:hypothetical protein TNCV_3114791 [Trichonephila clavipes]
MRPRNDILSSGNKNGKRGVRLGEFGGGGQISKQHHLAFSTASRDKGNDTLLARRFTPLVIISRRFLIRASRNLFSCLSAGAPEDPPCGEG